MPSRNAGYYDLAFNWVTTAVGIYFLLALLGHPLDPAWYFGAFVGVPFGTFYGGVAYYWVKKRWWNTK